jgi:hypothetical protein
VANSTVSMGPPESRPLARDLLEDWVVNVPDEVFFYPNKLEKRAACRETKS